VSFRVVFTAEAEDQARVIGDWWRENRRGSPDKFEDELDAAVGRLRDAPLPAQVYRSDPTVYRTLLRVTRNHVYFTIDEDHALVTIVNIWGGLRGRDPWLPRK
jgi:plasmid stabilization system protein ParE